MMKRFTKQLIITVMAAAVAVYLFVQFYLSVNVSYKIENVYMTSVEAKKSFDIYIFRDETPIYADSADETCSYLIDDGEKVHKNQQVAITYQNGSDVLTQEKINSLNEKLDVLSKSRTASLYSTNDLSRIDAEISANMLDIIKDVNNKSISLCSRSIKNITVAMNSKEAKISGIDMLKSIENALTAKRDELKATLTGKKTVISANMSGYFYSSVDGFENYFTEKALEELSLAGFESLKTMKPDQNILDNAIGKLSPVSKWNIACAMTKRQSSDLKKGMTYEFSFPNSYGARIKMTLDKKIVQPDSDTVIMVFSSNSLKEEFDFSRKQTAEFIFDNYVGLKVPTEAVRSVDGETGVYALEGNKVTFKAINVISVQSGYCIADLPENWESDKEREALSKRAEAIKQNIPVKDKNGEWLKEYKYEKLALYDAVIIGGKDLKEGMMLR